MKKLVIFLTCLCLSFNIYNVAPLAQPATNTIKEGIYNTSNLNLIQDKIYTVQNVSKDQNAHIILFNDHQEIIQYMKLLPNSEKQNLLPIKANYRIVIIGNADVFLA
ncbi:hypothetical protein SAMN02745163_01422 [Clostridium cavendishii DSM 21758]|uniref:Uncharacterized protein n=1 Tax=Clostridium cavendishii DSM 21758 TaxID=1121302 RepID=A0A1M6GXV5_9CLOT|nr:hypothetical protein [Clostridium cavendishii]SHJ14762.1 hypothetical protein SAMN02745163_01422 [Clostridium cavendishii DSM 21758]